MVQVLVVEVFAMGTFAWGEALLSDPEVSAAPKQAADLVRFIRSDESPHVEYLRTALSELRARQLRTHRRPRDRGPHRRRRHPAPRAERDRERAPEAAARGRAPRPRRGARKAAGRPESLIEEFDRLETPWTPPARTGFEPPLAASA